MFYAESIPDGKLFELFKSSKANKIDFKTAVLPKLKNFNPTLQTCFKFPPDDTEKFRVGLNDLITLAHVLMKQEKEQKAAGGKLKEEYENVQLEIQKLGLAGDSLAFVTDYLIKDEYLMLDDPYIFTQQARKRVRKYQEKLKTVEKDELGIFD